MTCRRPWRGVGSLSGLRSSREECADLINDARDVSDGRCWVETVFCQRVMARTTETTLESICDAWRFTIRRRRKRDAGRSLRDSFGASDALEIVQRKGGGRRENDARTLHILRDTSTSDRWCDWNSVVGLLSKPHFPDFRLEGARTVERLSKKVSRCGGVRSSSRRRRSISP